MTFAKRQMRSWYEFKSDASANETQVFIYDSIGGFGLSASAFIAQLQAVPAAHRLLVRIHSPGGSVLDGNAIFNAIKAHPGGVTTQIDGLAASMASVLAIAGKPARMAENALLMIHNVSGYAEGDAEEMREMAALTEKVQETIVQSYVERTGLSRRKIMKMMDDETWLDATEAKELGFVDEIGASVKMTATFDLSRFRNAPRVDMHKPNMADSIITPEEKSFLNSLRTFFAGGKATEVDPVAVLTSELSGLRAEVTNLRASLSEANDARDAAEDKLAAAEAKIETPEAIEAKVAAQVLARLSAAGVDPIKRDPAAATASADLTGTIWDAYNALPEGREKLAFYRENKTQLFADASAE